jgi:hypothetical protein
MLVLKRVSPARCPEEKPTALAPVVWETTAVGRDVPGLGSESRARGGWFHRQTNRKTLNIG